MATYNAGAGAGTLQINGSVGAVSGNSSRLDWSLILYCYNGQSWYSDPTVPWSVNIAGVGGSGGFGFDFRNTSSKVIATGSVWVGHDANGYATVTIAGSIGDSGTSISSSYVSGTFALPRIPKPPVTNGAPTVSNLTPTSAKFTWPANTNNNGAGIDQYLLRVSKNSNVEAAGYTDYPVNGSTYTYTVTGLTPGTQYYAAVYAHNSQGYAPKSATTSFRTLSGAYVKRGNEWRPTEVLVRKNGQWVTAEVYIFKSGAWKPAA